MSLQSKSLCALLGVLCGFLLTLFYQFRSTRLAMEQIEAINRDFFPHSIELVSIEADLKRVNRDFESAVVLLEDAAQLDAMKPAIERLLDSLNQVQASRYGAFRSSVEEMIAAARAYLEQAPGVYRRYLSSRRDSTVASAEVVRLGQHYQVLSASLGDLRMRYHDHVQKVLRELQTHNAETAETFTRILVLMSMAIIALFLGFHFLVIRRIARLEATSLCIREDLSQSVPDMGRDEIGLLAGSLESLRQAVVENEQQLRGKKEEAEAALATKNEFLAVMSHELRTPLNVVLGMSQLLEEANLDADQRRFVKSIRNSGQSLLRLVEDILDFSQLGKNRLSLRRETFNPRELIEETVQTHAKGRDGSVAFICSCTPAVPALATGDPVRLRQIVNNLVGNAAKFTAAGKVELRADAVQHAAGSWTLRVEVEDTGIGIPPEKQGDLFQMFSQLDMSSTRLYGGAGLGLAISRRLVELMRGGISVHSVPGQGSVFRFHVELDPVDAAASVPPPEAPTLPQRPARPDRKGVVLVAEDDPDGWLLIDQFLQRLGYERDLAENGQQVLDLVGRRAYDAILMDVRMPVMDGLETTRKLRARGAGIPIIALTANALDGDREAYLQAGMSDYLPKPVRIDILESVLRKHCAQAQS